MAWNIDYEYNSEEAIRLNRQIAEQGYFCHHRTCLSNFVVSHSIALSDNRYSTLQSQLIKTRDELEKKIGAG
jgi:hypothetical protein